MGYVLLIANNQSILASCDPGCVNCSYNSPSSCSNCSQGYVLKSGVCMPCSPNSNCQTCTPTNPSLCTSCFPNNFLDTVNSICKSCNYPCLTCLSLNLLSYCTSCPAGYSLLYGTCSAFYLNNRSSNSKSTVCLVGNVLI